MLSLTWPQTAIAQLAWMHTLLAWTVSAYCLNPIDGPSEPEAARVAKLARPARVVISSVVALLAPLLLLSGAPVKMTLLGLLGGILIISMNRQRRLPLKAPFATWAPWLEVATPVVYAAASAIAVGNVASLRLPIIRLPMPDAHIAAILVAITASLWSIRGGTSLVRTILASVDATPKDSTEASRGRLIGNIERLLLASMVAVGKYEALAFLIAAKGLIRSKQLEDHKYAEYFLIGTLISTTVAVIIGGIIRLAFLRMW